jgi:preprotein translocase subunit SecG
VNCAWSGAVFCGAQTADRPQPCGRNIFPLILPRLFKKCKHLFHFSRFFHASASCEKDAVFLRYLLKTGKFYGNIKVREMSSHALAWLKMLEVIPMDALVMVITILQLLCGLAVIFVVLLQSGKSAGLSGAIGGVADSFLSRNKAKTMDAKLARATKWVGAVFLILTLILLILG